MRKLIALLLALALGICIFVSCKKDDKNEVNSDSVPTESTSSVQDESKDNNKDESEKQDPAMEWSKPY